ncbi:DUF294 nucleotidyltransferase-like domain-containing protein [Salinithrix halophila]
MFSRKEWIRSLIRTVDKAAEMGELREIHRELPVQAEAMICEGVSPAEITRCVSGWHDSIIRRVLQLAEHRVRGEGAKPLPRYCWLVLGSSGREEATFWTDQDNALLYEAGELSAMEAEQVAARLAELAVKGLEEAGYPLCEGNVMATNPRWRGTLAEWEERLNTWVSDPGLDHARYTIIASDARPVCGEEQLYHRWRARFQSLLQENPAVLVKEAQRPSHRRVPLGPFSRLYPELHGNHAGEVDIKEGGYLQLVEAVRLWSLRYQGKKSSTRDRMDEISPILGWSERKVKEVGTALDTFLRLRLFIHSRLENGMDRDADNHIDPKSLGREELHLLKRAMRTAASLRKEVNRHGGEWDGIGG